VWNHYLWQVCYSIKDKSTEANYFIIRRRHKRSFCWFDFKEPQYPLGQTGGRKRDADSEGVRMAEMVKKTLKMRRR